MAITENSFTAEELHQAIQANPELLKEIKVVGPKAQLVVRTSDEETEYLKNYTKKQIDDKYFEWGNNIEKDVKEVYGEDLKKNENEPFYAFFKRVAKEKGTEFSTLKSELETLRQKGGNTSDADKSRISQLENLLNTEKTSLTEKLTAKEKEIQDLRKGYEIRSALSAFRSNYVKGMSDFAINASEKVIVEDILSRTKEIDGELVVVNEKGEVSLDPSTFKAKSIKQVIEEKLTEASMLDKGRQQPGTGGNAKEDPNPVMGVSKNDKGEIVAVTSVPATIKTKNQLMDHLMKLGIDRDSKVFSDAYSKFTKEMDLKVDYGVK